MTHQNITMVRWSYLIQQGDTRKKKKRRSTFVFRPRQGDILLNIDYDMYQINWKTWGNFSFFLSRCGFFLCTAQRMILPFTKPYDQKKKKKKKRTEPRSDLGVFKIKYFATAQVRCGAVFNVFYRTAPHHTILPFWQNRTAPYDSPFDRTAPNRTVGFSKNKNSHRTAP